MREALKLREQTFGMHHALTAQSLNDLAVLLYQSGRYDEATSLYQQALPIYREIYGPEHPEVATITNNIGRSALVAGRVDEAEPLLRQSLAMFQKFQGDNYDGLVSPLNSLAMIDAYRGRLGRGPQRNPASRVIARSPGQGELLDQVLLNEADIELADGNRARAAELLDRIEDAIAESHPDRPSRRVAVRRVGLGERATARGKRRLSRLPRACSPRRKRYWLDDLARPDSIACSRSGELC